MDEWIKRIFLLYAVGLLFGAPSHARYLRIIHTNDLHSQFESGNHAGIGGYLGVRATIERLEAQAAVEGSPTLVLDAGDFSEGSEFYLGDEGRNTFRILKHMGYHAVAIGNHDFLMGAAAFQRALESENFPFPFLSANLSCPRWPGIHRKVRPFTEVVRSGIRIAILGLTTDDPDYAWRLRGDCTIENPIDTARRWVPYLRSRNDVVIVLSHLGLDDDRRLAREVGGVDLIVGGHSHHALFRPEFVTSRESHPLLPRSESYRVPIVQASFHGEFVGSLWVDVDGHAPLTVFGYDLVPVRRVRPPWPSQLPVVAQEGVQGRLDPASLERHTPGLFGYFSQAQYRIQSAIQRAWDDLFRDYGRDWLFEVIGYSQVPLAQPTEESTEWGWFMAEAFRRKGRAEIGFNHTFFCGPPRPVGPVRRIDLLATYPRMFDFRNRLGWQIYTAHMTGFSLELLSRQLLSRHHQFSTAGMEVLTKLNPDTEHYEVDRILVQGQPLQPLRIYRVAIPEAIITGGIATQPALMSIAVDRPATTGVPIWRAMEEAFRELPGQILRPFPEGTRRTRFNPFEGRWSGFDRR